MEECLVFPSYTCLTRYPWPTSSLLCLSSSPGPYCMQGPPGRSPLLLLVMCIAPSCRCNFRFFSHSCDQITNRKKLKGQCLFRLMVYRCNSSWKERCFGKSVKLLAHIWDRNGGLTASHEACPPWIHLLELRLMPKGSTISQNKATSWELCIQTYEPTKCILQSNHNTASFSQTIPSTHMYICGLGAKG